MFTYFTTDSPFTLDKVIHLRTKPGDTVTLSIEALTEEQVNRLPRLRHVSTLFDGSTFEPGNTVYAWSGVCELYYRVTRTHLELVNKELEKSEQVENKFQGTGWHPFPTRNLPNLYDIVCIVGRSNHPLGHRNNTSFSLTGRRTRDLALGQHSFKKRPSSSAT